MDEALHQPPAAAELEATVAVEVAISAPTGTLRIDDVDGPQLLQQPSVLEVTEQQPLPPQTTTTVTAEHEATIGTSASTITSSIGNSSLPPDGDFIVTQTVVVTATNPTGSGGSTGTGSAITATHASVLGNAREEVNQMIERNEFDDANSVSAIQTLFRDYEAMKEKVTKLKTLLGRSAKAQRDAKVEIEILQKKYDSVQRENTKLLQKINKLSTRPTHMDLLADFETNFDRALLSASGKQQQQQQQQSGGQDTSGTTSSVLDSSDTGVGIGIVGSGDVGGFNVSKANNSNSAAMDNMLIQELSDSKQRIGTLEQYNATLVQRFTQLEQQYNTSKQTTTELIQKIAHVELEKKMATMEVDLITKQLQHNQSSLNEMQLEVELLSKQSTMQNNYAHHRRDSAGVTGTNVYGDASASSNKSSSTSSVSDRDLIQQLQEKVKALEEWAIAANHAKSIAHGRIRLLEQQLVSKDQRNDAMSIITDVSNRGGTGSSHDALLVSDTNSVNNNSNMERVLDTRKASLVIGAGDDGIIMFELDKELLKGVNGFTQRIVLRWKFDLLQGADADITFSILKGNCTANTSQRRTAESIIKDRIVKGGAGGEIDENAFSIGRSCTVVWSNKHSWIRPRTIKYVLEAIVMDD